MLKVLVIFDIIVYRIRVERFYIDMFIFLGDVLDVYLKYFIKELKDVIERCYMDVFLCSLGLVVIIFYEI